MDLLVYLICFLASIFIGFLSAIFGLGGGFLIVPFLTFLGVPIHHAVGTSSFVIIFSSLSSVFEYRKQKRVNYKAGILIAVPSIFGAYIGAWLTSYISSKLLKIIFGFLLLIVSFRMMRNGVKIEKKLNKWILILEGFSAGFMSGLLGIGGGIINVPVLASIGIPIHSAVATSTFSIFFTSISSALKHYFLGNIEIIWAIILIPGIITGAQIGAKFAKKIKAKHLRLAFALFLIVIAIAMIFKGLEF